LPRSVRRSLQPVEGALTFLEPKTEDSHRTINLPAVTIAALRQHQIRQSHTQEWKGSGWLGNQPNLVFTTIKGTPPDERGVLRRFQERTLKTAGVPKMRIHDLRHSAVAILMAQGVDARSPQSLWPPWPPGKMSTDPQVLCFLVRPERLELPAY